MSFPWPIPYLTGADDPAETAPARASEVQQNLDALGRSLPDTGGQAITLRAGEVTVPATSAVTVSHGLGRAPRSIVATTHFNAGTPAIDWTVQNVDADSFDLANPSATTANAYWIAVG